MDAEIKAPPLQRTQRYQRFSLSLKPMVGQNIASHASSTAMNPAFLISAFVVHSTSFFPIICKPEMTCNGDSELDFYDL